ncbi:MAG: hypothetical protein ABSB82_21700 [Terriglobia bacterium]
MRRLTFRLVLVLILFGVCAGQALSQTARKTGEPHPFTPGSPDWDPGKLGGSIRHDPIWVYNDWSSYDELSDNIPLTEALAMREFEQIRRLRKFGVHFDYYMMDAFWFDPDGAYRAWRKPSWPDGPDRWIAKCRASGILPGLWFGTNALVKINPAPQWRDSLTAKGGSMSLSEGGFLPDFMNTLQYWYDRGMRMFEFDFADFSAATPSAAKTKTPKEIETTNETVFREALKKFRQKNPDAALIAFNGFGGDFESTAGPFPFEHPVDLRWLEVFDSIYCGDPRPGDVPEMNFWRSLDIYSDHMVRRYEQSGVPLERIDPTSVMIGNTGTIYYRKTHAWKGMLLLMASRGGWINTIHGNLEFLSDEDARWFGRVEKIYQSFKARGRTKTFGGIPGESQPYGFGSLDASGAVYTVVNPAQSFEEIEFPLLTRTQESLRGGRVIFRDAGYVPILIGNIVKLGPGQMAAVGFGRYAASEFDLGVQEDVVIPRSLAAIAAPSVSAGHNTIETSVMAPAEGGVRIIFQQRGADGRIRRSWPGGPPNGTSMGKVLTISAEQKGKPLPVEIDYDKQIWSGLSWGVGEIKHKDFASGRPITIRCSSTEKDEAELDGHVFTVMY